MFFNVLWTILVGVIGGIVSSLIVSRVFLIESKYQEQLSFVANILRKVSYISEFLQFSKAIFEVSYDKDIEIEREMQEKGYKTKTEYYNAHRDENWIKQSNMLALFKKEINITAKTINSEIVDFHVVDTKIIEILQDIMKFVHEVSSVDELTFSSIADFTKKEQSLHDRYDKCVRTSGRTLCGLIVKDKLMIILFLFVVLLVVGTIITKLLNI